MPRVRPIAAAGLWLAAAAVVCASQPEPARPEPAAPAAPGGPAPFWFRAAVQPLALARGASDPKGYAVHISAEKVDPKSYKGLIPDLPSSLRDLKFMQKVAAKQGYQEVAALVGNTDKDASRCTRANVLKALKDAGEKARDGDIVLVTYSGHGALIPDDADDHDEKSGLDNTWCLFDGMLVDDEIWMALSKYRAGVRVVVVVDSCHSETSVKGNMLNAKDFSNLATAKAMNPTVATKDLIAANAAVKGKLDREAVPGQAAQVRALARTVEVETYFEHEALYKDLATKHNKEEVIRDPQKLAATTITLAACRDDQVAIEALTNGLFTREMSRLWKDGMYAGDYTTFDTEIQDKVSDSARGFTDRNGLPCVQVPRMTTNRAPSFTNQKLFSIK